ncbi:V-set and immunoglobulin domain-containing protein 10-like [Spea bombifrons]|uniref:V-set and immunoglobulin domain-containing protein 10-like n=1 Tax=Spea bombifrons TaxID=233779 RepID=UPI00234AAD67|nr:V-set and immunoglobulin domain-containing protein 10-like [Spea bombifrons]
MLLTRSLLTWALILSAAGPASSLRNVTGIQGGSVDLSVNLLLPEIQNRAIAWSFNSNVQIVTQYTDNPPRYSLEYENRCELFVNTTLQLRDLTAADRGEYTLTVQDLISLDTTTESVRLTVYSPASSLRNVTGILGGSVDLSANLLLPDIQNRLIAWDFNSTVLIVAQYTDNPPHYTPEYEDRCELFENITIQLRDLTAADQGDYTLSVQDLTSLIITTESVRLTVYSPASSLRNVTGILGGSVDLSANLPLPDIQNRLIAWDFNSSVLIVAQYTDNPPFYNPEYENRCELFVNTTLQLRDLTAADQGDYTLSAQDLISSIITTESVRLTVIRYPEDHIICSASKTDQTVQLLCSWTGGFPAADVRMFFQNQSETGQHQVIRNVSLKSINPRDELSCYGAQGGQEVSCVLKLDIPQAVGFTNHSSTEAVEGTSATMTVSLILGPSVLNAWAVQPETQILPSTFTWFSFTSENNPVPEGGKFMVTSTDYTSNLTISSVTMNEIGTYECRAENLFGSSSFFFILNVTSDRVSSSSGLGPGEIAGIVIGTLAGLAIVGAIAFFILKKRKASTGERQTPLHRTVISAATTKESEAVETPNDHIYEKPDPYETVLSGGRGFQTRT